jgi:hypothetical protein
MGTTSRSVTLTAGSLPVLHIPHPRRGLAAHFGPTPYSTHVSDEVPRLR